MKKDKHQQKGSLQTKYLVKTLPFFLDPIFKWQWKHYIMFEEEKNIQKKMLAFYLLFDGNAA